MSAAVELISATPVLASLDIERSIQFFVDKLNFRRVYCAPDSYGIVAQGPVSIHFWACHDRRIAEATGCRIAVRGIERLYQQCCHHGIVHPNAALVTQPWGNQEFAILDPDGNLVTFYEALRTDA